MDRQTRQRFAFVALVAFVAVGVWLFAPKVPRDVQLRLEVPPILRIEPRSIPREQIVRIEAVIRDVEGEEVARFDQDLGAGLSGPLTPPVPVRLAARDYLLEVRLFSAAGRRIPRVARFVVREAGALRVPLD